MLTKWTKALLLSTCLVSAGVVGTASADERNLVVPIIAGAAVGALIASNWHGGGHHHHRDNDYAPPRPVYYRRAPRPVYYQPAPQVIYYQPPPRPVYYRPAPPPRYWGYQQRFEGPRW